MRVDSSGQGALAVTTSDSVDLPLPSGIRYTKGIYVSVSGDLKVKFADGTTATFPNISSGFIHPLSVVKVLATGTTATGIVAVY